MDTAALIPVAEYLATSYRPDRDYVDGEVRERNLGETPHSGFQTYLASLFSLHRKDWKLRPFTEQRLQISDTRFRISDVCIVRPDGRPGLVLRQTPVICIEILSCGDTMIEMQERVDDYVSLGVENIWILDPVKRRAWFANADGIHHLTAQAFEVRGTPVTISLAELYAELDEIAAGR